LGSRTSPYLQEKLSLLGCENVFHAVPKIVESLLGIEVNETQVYRICQSVSSALSDDVINSPSEELAKIEENKRERVYGMVDGSMLQLDGGWQETKLGRVFKADMLENRDSFEWEMGKSEYVAHRGHCGEFMDKFEQLLSPKSACKKVFITDGAVWIGNWLSESYPEATHILDYFHVCEKLAEAAKQAPDGRKWLEKQKDSLLKGQHKAVCKAIKNLENLDLNTKNKLLNYFNNNAYRMKYKEYRQKGMMISSGPIEAAHRTVLQVRMKRSGQRWAENGCDNMLKLRVAYKSQKFHLITQIFKKNAA
jgi:hypothetical protein